MLSRIVLSISLCVPVFAQGFDEHFTGRVLRFAYDHVGTAGEERIAPVELRLEGEWPGSRTQLVDQLDLGKYRFELRDAESGVLLYSRGFCSIYGEWELTGEAKRRWRTFRESLRFPEPRAEFRLVLLERGEDGGFVELWSGGFDSGGVDVDRSAVVPRGEVITLGGDRPPAQAVDLLVVADGYSAAERDAFVADARRLLGSLMATEPFARRAADFNLRALFLPSAESGIPDPRKGLWPANGLGLRFNSFGSDRYVLTYEDELLREAAAQAPYDALFLLFNSRKYGGGGIYNLWATCAAKTEPAPYVFVHEFGHSFAGLADEYYSSSVAYEDLAPPGVEPWEPNITAQLEPDRLKWRDLVSADTPLPTPWCQPEYDAIQLAYQQERQAKITAKAGEAEMEALFRAHAAQAGPMLAADPMHGQVGAFQGAGYLAEGMYRPQIDCIMFSRNSSEFCAVCERAIERVIDLHSR